MRIISNIFKLMHTKASLWGVWGALFFTSCNDMHDVDRSTIFPSDDSQGSMLVLSEGLSNQNDSRLARYNFADKALVTDFFTQVNKRGLGDTANDMILHGSKLYVLVNISSQLEVLDAKTGLSIKRIPLFDESGKARQPRYAAAHEDKVYITCFDGTLQRLDTLSLEIDAEVLCGRNPEGVCIANEKLYVANSGGLEFPYYDSTVSVVDIQSFKEIKKIEVASNPYRIAADSQGDVYLSSRGDYGDDPYRFQRIDSYIDEVVQDFDDLRVLNFSIHDDLAYIYNYDFNEQTQWVKVFDCLQEKVVVENFISDDTQITTPYSVQVNPYNGDVFIVDAQYFIFWGDVLCFSREGKLKYRLNEIGLNMNKIIFLPG